ncbi:MAG TPA: threonylcarbamoyl-AMP synthase [Flavobacteriaceae bacterium]|jgi:L-threonylcarbamoyladenylate synthase|nr:threonylcarbamoyl-AMP synthase [Flavobacteriaceae bacterium]HBR52687.1 threonylcarbamoyl-AMP synthase [Flavobacteriaceae bacterium]HIB48192.1 threonylcarbamoyl-AMP synthase [Flavobacteriaceae bacterium]HIN98816.1 threonylcarbamoyl-AMP synthase [Flavobacteriaceae bacterium]|tara:strand:+ start:153 stop:713 length:561 start_codon:yes stop_codon:yes gene_type:complete
MKNEIENALAVLKRGGLILYPTDTVWGIGCDATNAEAIDKIYALKQRAESKSMICLVHDFKMLNQFVEEIPEVAYDILKYAAKPTTIIYDDPIRVATNLIAEDNSLAIRVTRDDFCKNLIRKFRKPIVSTSANLSGKATPRTFAEISEEIKNGVDYVVNLNQKAKSSAPSAIIKLTLDGGVKVIRE